MAVAQSKGLALICLTRDFSPNQGLTAPQEGSHEQRWFFLETSTRHFPSQGKAQSQNRHPSDTLRTGAEIGGDAGLPGTGLGIDIGYGILGVD